MKKIIAIVALTVLTLSSLQAQGNGNNAKMKQAYALKHANPLPNLMRVAKANKDVLGLSKDQLKTIKEWASVNKPKMKKMIQKVMRLEKAILEESLTIDKNTMKKGEKMLETRREIMLMKNACRANLKTILTASQYEQVVSIYKKKIAKK